MERDEVNVAFEILLEAIKSAANARKETGAEAFHAGDYERAGAAAEEASRLAEFLEKVEGLQEEWAEFSSSRTPARKPEGRKSKSRLPRGLRTPEDAFRRPILEALVELGGGAPTGDVLELVGKKMKSMLNEYDYQSLPSDPRSVRWRKTAQWCRHTLVRKELMKKDSPRGVWEISDAGRRWLENEVLQS